MPTGTWNLAVDLSDPRDEEDKPITFRNLDVTSVERELRGFRSSRVEVLGRTALRIRAEIDGGSGREAADQLWHVIEKVFYTERDRRLFWSMRIRFLEASSGSSASAGALGPPPPRAGLRRRTDPQLR